MTNHMHVAGYFPEAYDGRIEVDGKDYSIAELATARELPPILKRHGDWVVTKDGVENLKQHYSVLKERFDETDWVEHVGEKTWVNEVDFAAALSSAEDMVRLGII